MSDFTPHHLRNFGRGFILAGIAMPVLVWIGGQIWLSRLAALDPIPDQGAMVVAGLAVLASVFIAFVLIIIGIHFLRQAIFHETKPVDFDLKRPEPTPNPKSTP